MEEQEAEPDLEAVQWVACKGHFLDLKKHTKVVLLRMLLFSTKRATNYSIIQTMLVTMSDIMEQ